MTDGNGARTWAIAGVALAIGLVVGYLAGRSEGPPPVNPQLRALDADLWMQTSAEYHACCLQTYRFAGERLASKLARLPKDGLSPAVIMDLDETVLDNSPFQTWLAVHSLDYGDNLWERYEKDCPDQVRLVPGALSFIRNAENAGLTVVYVSNRLAKLGDSTRQALAHLGISTKDFDARFLGSTTTSDKTARRDRVRERYRVVMLVGDNLRDFSEMFRAPEVQPDDVAGLKKAIANRIATVDREKSHFGDDWIILPNPCYGEWTKLQGNQPIEVLHPLTLSPP